MRIGALQFDVQAGAFEANWEAVEDGLRQAAADQVKLVVLPEMWPSSFMVDVSDADVERSDASLERLKQLSRELGISVAGSAYGAAAAERPTNRFHYIESGSLLTSYDKVHLFTLSGEGEGFSAGDAAPTTIATDAGRVCGVVCYDIRFPEVTRVAFRSGVEILCVCAQWPVVRAAHWRALLVGRAVENQCFVIGANRTGTAHIGRRQQRLDFCGNSLVASPHGAVLAEGVEDERLVYADIDLEEARALKARVPVQRDERIADYRRWMS